MNLVIAGGSGGIGSAFVEALAKRPAVRRIIATCHRNPFTLDHPKVTWQRLDLTDEAAVRDWAQGTGEIDWLINTAGRLYTPAKGPERSIRQICARGAGGQPAQQQAPGVGDEGARGKGAKPKVSIEGQEQTPAHRRIREFCALTCQLCLLYSNCKSIGA